MKTHKPEIKYSEPVSEIMGTPPPGILRWGTTVIIAVFIMLFIISWLIKYPDFVASPVEITTQNPPVTLYSRINGTIKQWLVVDRDSIYREQVLAVMETAADFSEIRQLKMFCDTVEGVNSVIKSGTPDLTRLGELQNRFSLFKKSLSELSSNIGNDPYGTRIASTKLELAGLDNYLKQLLEKEKFLVRNLELETVNYKRMASLLSGGAVAQADLDNSQQVLNRQKADLQTVRTDISGTRLEILKKEQLIREFSVSKSEIYDKLYSVADEAFRNLRAELKIWENRYLLVSPVDGSVTFTRYWKENQSVKENEPVLSIIPFQQGKYIGRITLGMQRSGKVMEGQLVNIKLSSFPYLEYGMVRGVVSLKAEVPSDNAYMINIELPDGLTTLYGNKLEFTQNMQGIAEIITNDRSLLEKIASPFQHIVSKSK